MSEPGWFVPISHSQRAASLRHGWRCRARRIGAVAATARSREIAPRKGSCQSDPTSVARAQRASCRCPNRAGSSRVATVNARYPSRRVEVMHDAATATARSREIAPRAGGDPDDPRGSLGAQRVVRRCPNRAGLILSDQWKVKRVGWLGWRGLARARCSVGHKIERTINQIVMSRSPMGVFSG